MCAGDAGLVADFADLLIHLFAGKHHLGGIRVPEIDRRDRFDPLSDRFGFQCHPLFVHMLPAGDERNEQQDKTDRYDECSDDHNDQLLGRLYRGLVISVAHEASFREIPWPGRLPDFRMEQTANYIAKQIRSDSPGRYQGSAVRPGRSGR